MIIIKKIAINKWDEIGKKCFKAADRILPICRHLEDVVKNHYPQKSTAVMYQGISAENWFENSGMKLKHPCVGLVQGAVILEKTQELLTLTKVLERMPETTFYWVGDGPYKDNVLPTLKKSDIYPEKCSYCQYCPWLDVCEKRWGDDNYINQVARINKSQVVKLKKEKILILKKG